MKKKTGVRENDLIIGRYGDDTLNNNAYNLIEACETFKLKILNIYYKYRDIYSFTWSQPTNQLRSDYFITRHRYNL